MIRMFFIIGLIGGGAPLLFLLLMAWLDPAHDPVTRMKATERAYKILTWIGVLLSVLFVLLFLMFIQTGIDNEWPLGLYNAWVIFVCPFLALLLIPLLYGLYDSINAQRHREFKLIAVHSSLVYVVAFILMFQLGVDNLLLPIYLPTVVSYPIICIWLCKHGKRKLRTNIS